MFMGSGAAGGVEGSVGQSADAGDRAIGDTGQEVGLTAAPEQCRSARGAVPFYRGKTWAAQAAREARALADRTPVVRGRSCHWARYASEEHRARAHTAAHRLEQWRVQMLDPEFAIMHVFGPVHGPGAIMVAKCESGDEEDGRLSPSAVRAGNGQYQGMFQMGSSERRIYGHGSTPREQAEAAHRYFLASGSDWSPWQCRPYGLEW